MDEEWDPWIPPRNRREERLGVTLLIVASILGVPAMFLWMGCVDATASHVKRDVRRRGGMTVRPGSSPTNLLRRDDAEVKPEAR